MRYISKFAVLTLLCCIVPVSCEKEPEPKQMVYFPGDGDNYWTGDKTSLYGGDPVMADIQIPNGIKSTGYLEPFEEFEKHDHDGSVFDVWILESTVPEDFTPPEDEDDLGFKEGVDVYAVIRPDVAALDAWSGRQGLSLDFSPFEGYDFVAFNAYGDMCSVSSFGEDATGLLMGFVDWTKTLHTSIFGDYVQKNTLAADNSIPFVKGYDDHFKMHSDNHTIAFSVNNVCFAEVICSDKDYRSGRGHLDYKWDIRPIHVFNGSSNPGDYYMVSLDVTLVSNGMYDSQHKDITHGGVHVRNRGFYAKELSVTTTICNKDNNGNYTPVNGFFSQRPTPETTVGKTVYNHGLGFFFNGDITGGMNLNLDGLNAKFSATLMGGLTIGSSEQRAISDLDIHNNSYSNLSKYTYKFNNSPHMPGGWCYLTEPTPVSVGGALFHQDFILYVKDVPDYSDVQHYLNVNIDNLVYGICRFYTTKADFKEFIVDLNDSRMQGQIKKDRSFYVKLPKPNRIPTGLVEIRNDGSSILVDRYIFKVEFVSTKNPTVKYTYDKSSIGSGLLEKFSKTIPEGEYNVNIQFGRNRGEDGYYNMTTYRPITVSRSEPNEMSVKADFRRVD